MDYLLFPALDTVHADNGGCAILSPPWSHPSRRLGSSVLILGIKGEVSLTDGGIARTIRPGSVVLLPAGSIHEGARPLDASAQYYWLHFSMPSHPVLLAEDEADTILSDPDIAAHRLDGAALLPLSYALRQPEPFFQAFRELLFEQETPSFTQQKFQVLFRLLLIQLTEQFMAARLPSHEGAGKASVAYAIVTHLSETLTNPNVSIKTIADSVGLNPDYAGRKFRETMGISVGAYILRRRIDLAVTLLQDTNDTVDHIAEACGFGNRRHFMRQFKKEKAMTPSDLRRRHRMMHVNSL